jgi:putative ABC transport system permease protein
MFRNYLKIAWRNLGKHKGDAAINLVGLCVAFTSALLLFLSVYFEFSFDGFHRNAKKIYHVYTTVSDKDGAYTSTSLPVSMTPALKDAYPEIDSYARYITANGSVRYKDKALNLNLRLTDPDFLNMFSFPVIKGSKQGALADMNSVVLSKRSADAVFGQDEPVGKILEMQVGGRWKPFTVSAVTENAPENSSIVFDMLIRFENDENYTRNLTDWDSWNHSAYVQLKEGASAEALSKRATPFLAEHFAESITGLKRDGVPPNADGAYMQLGFLPLSKMHTDAEMRLEGNAIARSYLYLLLAIGSLILLIACINFVNLSIGRSFTRSHEIGLRKTLGALRWHVVGQLWVEALLICLIALVVSGIITYLLLPHYTQLFGMKIRRDLLLSPSVWLAIVGCFIVVTSLAGGYPAWLIARVNIIQILKGRFSIRRSQKIRNSLIVVQFSIAVLLMICTIVSWQQINYLRAKPLGYNRSQVISVPLESEQNPNDLLGQLRQKIGSYPSVESISGIYNNLGRGTDGSSRHSNIGFDYKNRTVSSAWLGVSHDFVKTLDLALVAGRDFSRDFPTDSNAVVINEAMARQLDEANIIGTQLPVHDSAQPMTVIGVVKDFNYESLHQKIEPVSFVLEKDFGVHYALVKVKAGNLPASMELVRNAWKQLLPNTEFKGSFLDENIDRQYRREEKMGQIFISGAVIAIVLSCMGLLAMVLLIVTQRVKEIGIRKVLGASVPNIVGLISKDFIWLIVLAFLIAAPLAWWGMREWLSHYAYRIDLQWWVFGLAGVAALLIAFLTICLQTVRAALSNPVKNLRTE